MASSTTKTNTTTSDVESDLGTLIINDETDDEDYDKTLKPAFLQHFERNESKLVLIFIEFRLKFVKLSEILGQRKRRRNTYPVFGSNESNAFRGIDYS